MSVGADTPRKRQGVRGGGYDERTAERVRRILSGRRDVVEKRMVGGLSFMVNGSMCCGVTGAALMVRVGSEARERALDQPHVRQMEFAGRPLGGFVCVDPGGYRTDKALATWIQRGIDFVSTLPVKKPPRGAANNPKPLIFGGVPEGIRTPDLRFRKPLLYPAELPGRVSHDLACSAWPANGARPDGAASTARLSR